MTLSVGNFYELRPKTWSDSLPVVVRSNLEAQSMIPLSYMELILTTDCNLRCSYCFEKNKQQLSMPIEVATSAVDFFVRASRQNKSISILLFGGEPMIKFDMIQKIVPYANAKAKESGKIIHWDMTTNGTLIDETCARWLAENKVKYLLSLDGAREDHDRFRRFSDGQGSYDLIIKRLPMMKSYQPWMGVKMSITPESTLNMRDNLYELWKNGINQFIIGYAHGMKWSDHDLLNYERGMMGVCELYLEMEYQKKHFRITMFEEETICDVKNVSFGCGAGSGRFCVDPFGDFYGCSKLCTINGQDGGILPLGNVHQGFTRIKNRYHCLNESIVPRRKCQKCELQNRCGGGCPAVNVTETGNYYLPDDTACKLGMVCLRVDSYFRKRHDEVFGTNWVEQVKIKERALNSQLL